MKYFKHTWMIGGEKIIRAYQPEGTNMYIPPKAGNTDFDNMMDGLNADPPTNIIEEIDDTP